MRWAVATACRVKSRWDGKSLDLLALPGQMAETAWAKSRLGCEYWELLFE